MKGFQRIGPGQYRNARGQMRTPQRGHMGPREQQPMQMPMQPTPRPMMLPQNFTPQPRPGMPPQQGQMQPAVMPPNWQGGPPMSTPDPYQMGAGFPGGGPMPQQQGGQLQGQQMLRPQVRPMRPAQPQGILSKPPVY